MTKIETYCSLIPQIIFCISKLPKYCPYAQYLVKFLNGYEIPILYDHYEG